MDSFNFSGIVLHPNTETLLIHKRDSLLKENHRDYFPLFPLYGIFSDAQFSLTQKADFKNCSDAFLDEYFICDDILYMKGSFNGQNQIPFIIPCAVKNDCNCKKLSAVFSAAFNCLKDLKQKNRQINSTGFEKISFRSFQIADCHMTENQYSLFENFWVKTIS